MRLFKGDDGRREGGGASGSRGGDGGGGGKLMSKARALLQTAAAPLSARRERASSVDRPYFNPEEHISEKREWARRYTQSHTEGSGAGVGGERLGGTPGPKPDRLFEHFCVVGLPPTMNIRAVAADIKTFQRVAREAAAAGGGAAGAAAAAAAAGGLEVMADTPREEKQRQYGLKGPAHAAQVLYTFASPPGLPADLAEGLPSFCFPHGVRPELLERTPSMSALNEVIYSQPYQTHDDHSFVFTMKVTEPGSVTPRTLYGVCCHVRELVHRPPSMAREAFPGCTAPLSRYLVVAPRCYCLLTHHPFFALHFRVLQTILGLERLERMTLFAAELAGGESSGAPGWGASSSAATSASASQAASVSGATTAGASPGGGGQAAAGASSAGGAAAAAGAAQEDEEASSETSSRRWTEGSSVAAAEELLPRQQQQHQQQQVQQQQQAGDAAVAALLGLTLSEQQQQLAQAARPSRMAQVSPLCPGLPLEAAGAAATPQDSSQAAAAAEGQGEALTPPDLIPALGAGAGVGPTPFFTPAGLSSAIGTPGSQREQQQAQQEPLAAVGEGSPEQASLDVQDSSSIRRALAGMLAEADGSTDSPAAVAAAAGDSADTEDVAEAALAAAVASSRPGSRQRRGSGDASDSDSDGSYLSASSSAALLAQASSLDASPATTTALLSARKSQHLRSVSGTSLSSLSPVPATLAGAADEQGPEELPPLLDLAEAPAAEQQQQRQQQQQPPLLDFELGEPSSVQEQQLGGGVAVRIVTRSYSSPARVPPDALPRADMLGGGAFFGSGRHAVSLPLERTPEPAAGGQPAAAGSDAQQQQQQQLQDVQQPAAWQQQGQQQQGRHLEALPEGFPEAGPSQGSEPPGLVTHEVVHVTASNLDMSRPLRSADLLAVYHASVVPRPGQVFEFQPDPGLQTIQFQRPDFSEAVTELGLRPDAASLPDIDAAQNLGGWAVAALCRALSLDNILTFLTAALLERQIVVFCPNAGLLSGVVLSLVPLLLPFHWQSLLLPVLPAAEGRLELIEAPVPFVLGVLYKTQEVRAKCGALVRVNVYKDKVKNAGAGLPPLPQLAALHDALAGTHAELRKIGLTRAARTRPVHMISDAQQVLAECFLSTLQKYLRGLVADLRAYCITDVSPAMERTSVLLKDSFVDSFPPRDRAFMRAFAETQMFAVHTDCAI